MGDDIAELVKARRARLWRTIQHLEDDDLRALVEESYRATDRTIEEWHDFVEGVELAMKALRDCWRNVARHQAEAWAELAS